MGIICLPFLILPSKFLKFPIKIWIKVIFIFLENICNIRHKIEGMENIPNETVLIASKHQSAFETFALYYYLKKSFFVHKKQLFYIPIFGQYLLKSNMVAINRSGRATAMRKMLSDVKNKLKKGSSIIIFPEGTRKLPGEPPDYKTGFIGIYKATNRKLLPVALNSGICWTKYSWLIKNGHIVIKILPTIEANLEKNEVLQIVENTIEKETNKLLA